ncbi:MAG TPA: MarR family winged helix-turn-helix transcriptional regulator [Verrucomicrobiae bacterium]
MTKEMDLSAMENCLCFNLRWITRIVTQFFTTKLSPHGILPTQTPILAALAAQPSSTMAQLSDWLGMDRTTLIRNLRPLQRDGLVKLSGTGRGGRVILTITAKGKSALARLMPDWQGAQIAVVQTLGKERWSAILSDLERAALALAK